LSPRAVPKIVYLNAPARALLQQLPRIADNPRVIPGMRADSASASIDKAWANARAAAELVDVRLHDLRHSFASVGAAGGLSLPIIGALLGHKHTTTTARYAHLSAYPLRAANDAVGARIAAAMSRRMSATTFAIWNTPLPTVVSGPVIANGSFTSTPVKRGAGTRRSTGVGAPDNIATQMLAAHGGIFVHRKSPEA